MTTADAVIKLLQDNLHLIFAEPDEEKRLAQLGRLWFADSECFFIDPLGVFTTHKSISDLTAGLLASNAGNIFTELGSTFQIRIHRSKADFHYSSWSSVI